MKIRSFLPAGSIIAGFLMVIKGGVILLTGRQPPYLFEIAPLFLRFGLWGLYLCLPDAARGSLSQVGLAMGVAAAVSAPVYVWAELFAPHLIPQEETVTIITPFVVLAGMGAMVSALMLGFTVWRTKAVPQAWLPLAIPLGFVGLMVLVILLEGLIEETVLSDRLIEIPIVIIGLAWLWLGFVTRRRLSA